MARFTTLVFLTLCVSCLALCPNLMGVMKGSKVVGGNSAVISGTGKAVATAHISGNEGLVHIRLTIISPLTSNVTGITINGPAAWNTTGSHAFNMTVDVGLLPSATYFDEQFPLTDTQLADLSAGKYYVQVMTANHTAGELRAQLETPTCYEALAADLSGVGTHRAYAQAIVEKGDAEVVFNVFYDVVAGSLNEITVWGPVGVQDPWHGPSSLPSTRQFWLFFATHGLYGKLYHTYLRTMTPTQLNMLKSGQLYLQMSTTTFPDGQNRGWFQPSTPGDCPHHSSWLSGSQILPSATGSSATAFATVNFDYSLLRATVLLQFGSLPTSNVVAIGLYGPANTTTNGTLWFNLTTTTGMKLMRTTFNVTAYQIHTMRRGLTYFQIDTLAYPSGEIRGKIENPTCVVATSLNPPTNVSTTGFGMWADSMVLVSPSLDMVAVSHHVYHKSSTYSSIGLHGPATSSTQFVSAVATLPSNSDNDYVILAVNSVVKADLLLGKYYIGVHTVGTPNELRSNLQVKKWHDPTKYEVLSGDTLSSVATKVGLNHFAAVQMLNHLADADSVTVGQMLNICHQHKVKAGESLYSIATKYGRTYQELKRWNPAVFDIMYIAPGDVICVQPALKRSLCGYPM